jgi:glycosyltransferase involved in cell wall biosynthesis
MTKSKLSVSFLIWNSKKCGGNKIIFEIANRLVEKGYGVEVYKILGGNVNWFPTKVRPISFFSFSWLFQKPSFLIATFWPTAYLTAFMPARQKMYFIQNWEADFYSNPLFSFLARLTFKFPFTHFTISHFLQNKILKRCKRNAFLLPLAIDLSVFKPGLCNKRDTKKIRILSVVSSYDNFKGVKELISAVRKLKQKHPDWHFILISFEKYCLSSLFDEFISDPLPLRLTEEYQRANLFLQTSKIEGFPLPPLEAMACGTAVIATDSGGIKEYAKNGYNCLLAKNIKEMISQGMVEQVIEDFGLRNKLSQNGQKTAKMFSWDKTIFKLEEYLGKWVKEDS